jgi:hypothetical protein
MWCKNVITNELSSSQFGYFQIANPATPNNIVTTLETINQLETECASLFPTGLPSSPNVTAVTQFGGWTQNPTRVMFTNGERSLHLFRLGDTALLTDICLSGSVADALGCIDRAGCAQPAGNHHSAWIQQCTGPQPILWSCVSWPGSCRR